MHDELERAVTGTSRRGLSPLGWLLVTFGFFVLLGTVGAGLVAYKVANGVRDGIGSVTRELGATPSVAAARMAARLASADELVAMDPGRGLALLSEVERLDEPVEVMRALSAPLPAPDGSAHPEVPDEAGLDVTSLRIDSDEGSVSFRLARSADGGSLAMDSDEGAVRIELLGGDEGGRIRVHTAEGEMEASFGDDAGRAPGWVSGFGEIPHRTRPVVSIVSDGAHLGAIAWEADARASDLITRYRAALEAAGYEVRAEHGMREGSDEHGSLWARDDADGRMMFVVAHGDGSRTGVLLGYGEER